MLEDMIYKPKHNPLNPLRRQVNYAIRHDDRFLYRESKERLKDVGTQIAGKKFMERGQVVKLNELVRYFMGMGMDTVFIFGATISEVLERFIPGMEMMRALENSKRDSGEWGIVPWEREVWFKESAYFHLHALHMSEQTPGNVAFAQTVEKGAANKFVSIKPGKYLTKFFSDVLNENEIREWAERCAAYSLDIELKFIESNDPNGWVKVYDEGPDSCMHGMECVKVYAHDKSVLRLAYTTQGGTIVGRAIVREDTNPKQYIRVYPNNDSPQDGKYQTKLKEMLEELGYEHGDLHGVLLAAIPLNCDIYLMPYLDRGAASDTPYVSLIHKDGKHYFKVGERGDFLAASTSGELHLDEGGEECAHCGERCDPDDMTGVDDHGLVCERCFSDHYVWAVGRRGAEVAVHYDDAVFCHDNDTYYIEEYASHNGIGQCEQSGRWYSDDNLVCTSRGNIHLDIANALDEPDSDGNGYAHERDTTTTHDGRTIHTDCSKIVDGLVYHIGDEINEQEAA